MATSYGADFDRLAQRWNVIENAHDEIHPDRNECGGVGGCPIMAKAVDLEHAMIDALEKWRKNPRTTLVMRRVGS